MEMHPIINSENVVEIREGYFGWKITEAFVNPMTQSGIHIIYTIYPVCRNGTCFPSSINNQ